MKQSKLVTLSCQICGNPYLGEEPEICCSGKECGCMGLPVEPLVCSDACNNILTKTYPKMPGLEVWSDIIIQGRLTTPDEFMQKHATPEQFARGIEILEQFGPDVCDEQWLDCFYKYVTENRISYTKVDSESID